MRKQKYWRATFKPKEDHLPFPIDMLRRDHCWPSRQEDSERILASVTHALGGGDMSEVTVFRLGTASESGFDLPRWESFGWVLVKEQHI